VAITITAVMRKDKFTVENLGAGVAGVRAIGTGLARPPAVSDGTGGSITHGRQITASNTGHTAYFDAGLGRTLVDGDLTVSSGLVSLSDFVANNGTITKRWFQNGLIMDRNGVTLTGCKFDRGVSGFYSGVHHPFTLNYCTIDTPGAAGDDGIQYQDYTATRCRIGGNSDGCKTNGAVTLTECYIRVEGQDSADHNDGTQAVGSYTGNTIVRCNIDCRPTNGTGAPNAALFVADSSSGLQTWTDNWVAGGGYVLRCYENSTYIVTGTDVLDGSWVFGPADRAVIPQSNLTWSNNRIVNSSGGLVSTLAAP
jgi:hypothetical protein